MPTAKTTAERGRTSFHAGLAAESVVLLHYQREGSALLAERWRGSAGEIDLVFQDDDVIVFVEVKKSATFAQAAARVSIRQQQRIFAAAQEFLSSQPAGLLTATRFDAALVDNLGKVEIIQNAFTGD